MINIVLYEPEIPQNTGNIMRTCAATNIHLHLIRPLGFVINDKTLKRCGVNYIENCSYTIYDDINDFYEKNKGTYYYLTRYGHKAPSCFDFSDPLENIYFILGKESTGIPTSLMKDKIDNCIRLPMSDKVRALNVSNTAAIIIYEALRQQNYKGLLFDDPYKGKNFIENS